MGVAYAAYDFDASYAAYDSDASYAAYDFDASYAAYDFDASYAAYDFDAAICGMRFWGYRSCGRRPGWGTRRRFTFRTRMAMANAACARARRVWSS